jgi:hypothetical protein
MFWASKRQTTRKEDEAYCLLGLFGINMPLLYGEGERAFQRLQQEIIRTSTDQSVPAWEIIHQEGGRYPLLSLLAPSPANFYAKAQHIITSTRQCQRDRGGFRFTSEGIEIELALDAYRIKNGYNTIAAALDCVMEGSQIRIGLWLEIHPNDLAQGLNSGHRLEVRFTTDETSKATVDWWRCRILSPLPMMMRIIHC